MGPKRSGIANLLLGANVILAIIVAGVVWMLTNKNLSEDSLAVTAVPTSYSQQLGQQ